jgi:beta-galactosidase
MLDENDNQLYYFEEPLVLSAEGAIELIGPDVIAMQGGMTGVYVRTTGESGTGILHIKNAQAEECSIVFTVKADKSGEL